MLIQPEIGSKLLLEPSSTVLTSKEAKIFHELKPAAVMFRARNFLFDKPYEVWLPAFKALLSDIREAIARDTLMVTIDHEGGRVVRPPHPITRFPYADRWVDAATEVGKAMAVELKSLGINVNFAPCTDLKTNPDSKVIGPRAFHKDPEFVTKQALAVAKALQDGGITPAAKHFPGHGDAREDSHFNLPVIDHDLNFLHSRELIPFKALIDAGIELVMTAHILFPKIDPENQATLSERILHNLLRDELKFNGVTVADALGMYAINKDIKNSSTISQAVNIGLDLFCLVGDNISLDFSKEVASRINTALLNGEINKDAFDQSVDRIKRLLEKLPRYDVVELPAEIFNRNATLAHSLDPNDEWKEFQFKPAGFT